MYKLYLLFITFCCFCNSLNAVSVPSLVSQLQEKKGAERIVYLHYLIGNEPFLFESKEHLEAFLQSLQQLDDKADKHFTEQVALFSNTYENIVEKDIPKRITLINRQLDDYAPNSEEYAHLLHQIGTNYFVTKEYAKAFEYYISAHHIFKEIGWEKIPQAGVYLHDIALAYFTFNEYEKAIDAMRIALKLLPFSPNLDIQRYNTIADAFNKLGMNDSATFYYHRLNKVATTYADSFWIVQSMLNVLTLEEMQLSGVEIKNRLASIYQYLPANAKKTFELNDENEYLYWKLKIKELSICIEHFDVSQCITIAEELEQLEDLKDFALFRWHQTNQDLLLKRYKVLKEYYSKVGDYKRALLYTDKYFDILQEINAYQSSNILKRTEERLALAKNNLELAALEKARLNNRTIIVVLSLGLLLILFILLYIKNKVAKEREINKNEQQQLQHQLELNNNELKHYIQNIVTKNEIIESINDELEKLKTEHQLIKQQTDIQTKIDELKSAKILTSDDWQTFLNLFKRVNPTLSNKLFNVEPKLTESEIRYMMLLSLDMNHKDIAASLGISADSLRVTWSRIKKKFSDLKLETPHQLLEWILNHEPQ